MEIKAASRLRAAAISPKVRKILDTVIDKIEDEGYEVHHYTSSQHNGFSITGGPALAAALRVIKEFGFKPASFMPRNGIYKDYVYKAPGFDMMLTSHDAPGSDYHFYATERPT